ncbi:hypothetical protein ACFE04_006799 [Oxalis oulophora]
MPSPATQKIPIDQLKITMLEELSQIIPQAPYYSDSEAVPATTKSLASSLQSPEVYRSALQLTERRRQERRLLYEFKPLLRSKPMGCFDASNQTRKTSMSAFTTNRNRIRPIP